MCDSRAYAAVIIMTVQLWFFAAMFLMACTLNCHIFVSSCQVVSMGMWQLWWYPGLYWIKPCSRTPSFEIFREDVTILGGNQSRQDDKFDSSKMSRWQPPVCTVGDWPLYFSVPPACMQAALQYITVLPITGLPSFAKASNYNCHKCLFILFFNARKCTAACAQFILLCL